MTKKESIDIRESLEYFFTLPDWKMRTIWIGGVSILGIALFGIAILFLFIPFLGWIIGCGLIILLLIGYIAFWIGIQGYQYELIKNIKSGKAAKPFRFTLFKKEQFKHGLKLFVGDIIYTIPGLILYSLTYIFIFLPMIFLGESDTNSTNLGGMFFLPLMLASYVPMFLGWFYIVFQQYFIFPSMRIIYLQREHFSDIFNFKYMKNLIKNNLINLLIYFALFFAIIMLMQFLFMFSFLLIFICIGIFITPVVLSITVTYFIHFQAHFIGQLAKINE